MWPRIGLYKASTYPKVVAASLATGFSSSLASSTDCRRNSGSSAHGLGTALRAGRTNANWVSGSGGRVPVERAINRWPTAFEESELRPSALKGRFLELGIREVEISVEQARISAEILILQNSTPSVMQISDHAEMVERVLRSDGNSQEKKRVCCCLIDTLVVQPGRSIEPTLQIPSMSDIV